MIADAAGVMDAAATSRSVGVVTSADSREHTRYLPADGSLTVTLGMLQELKQHHGADLPVFLKHALGDNHQVTLAVRA